MRKIIIIFIFFIICMYSEAQWIVEATFAKKYLNCAVLSTPSPIFLSMQSKLSSTIGPLLKKRERKTTLYIGFGIGKFMQEKETQFLASSTIDFAFFKFLHLNTGLDAFAGNTKRSSALLISAVPEFSLCFENLEFLLGIGVFNGIYWGSSGGMAPGILALFKFNFFISKNIGIGLELKHPFSFDDTHFLLMSTLGVNFKL